MKAYSYLVEVDRLLGRSWMYLMTTEDLVECSSIIEVELLDMLHVFTMKAPLDVGYMNHEVS